MTDDLREAVARAVCLSFYGTQWEATSEFRRGICYEMADAAISALAITRATLAGLRDGSLVAVPVEPTEAMLEAGEIALAEEGVDNVKPDDAPAAYRAMVAARPNASAKEAGHE